MILASQKRRLAFLSVLSLTVLSLFAQNRKAEIWDFGGTQSPETYFVQHLNPQVLDSLPDLSGGKFTGAELRFGDLAIYTVANDRLYYYSEGSTPGKNSYGKSSYTYAEFDDGYRANGMWYCNGTGGESRRYMILDNVRAGDLLSFYIRTSNGAKDSLHLRHLDDKGIPSGLQEENAEIGGIAQKYTYLAKADGSYKLYTGTEGGKALFFRVQRTPAIPVSGVVGNFFARPSGDWRIEFVNKLSGEVVRANSEPNGKFSAFLTPGYEYTAILRGSVGTVIKAANSSVSVGEADLRKGAKVNLRLPIERRKIIQVTGSLQGLDATSDLSKASIVFTAAQDSGYEPSPATIDSAAKTYSVKLEPGVRWTAIVQGLPDWELSAASAVIQSTGNLSQDLSFTRKRQYTANGHIQNLPDAVVLRGLVFEHNEDGARYPASINGDKWTAKLREGVYRAIAEAELWTTKAHVVIEKRNISKDIWMSPVTASEQSLPLKQNLYVAHPDKENNYPSISAALSAAKAMKPESEEQRVRINIAPGIYREQVRVDAPYISLVNSGREEVRISWYYGEGYRYYSAGADGYYDLDLAKDAWAKTEATAATLIVEASALGFEAVGIHVENSFNRYITDEELADGVEATAQLPARKLNSEVRIQAAAAEAAALKLAASGARFQNCRFSGMRGVLDVSESTAANIVDTALFSGCSLEAPANSVAKLPAGLRVQEATWADLDGRARVRSIQSGAREEGKINIFLAGDSTVKDYSAYGMHNSGTIRDEGSWGEFLPYYFNPEKVAVINYANGGRSARSFINEGLLDGIAKNIRKGDWLFIQFGHNDASNQATHLEERYVPLGTPDANGVWPVSAGPRSPSPAAFADRYGPEFYAHDNGATWKWYLSQYIDTALAAGATPVLVTPVSRMYFNADGTIKPHHDAKDSPTYVNAYVQAMHQLAKERGVLLIDAFELTKDMFEAAWKASGNSNVLAQQTMFPGDSTHSSKMGGFIQAALLLQAMREQKLPLLRDLQAPVRVPGENADGQYVFSVGANSSFTAFAKGFSPRYELVSEYWTKLGQALLEDLFGK